LEFRKLDCWRSIAVAAVVEEAGKKGIKAGVILLETIGTELLVHK
jgi:hypothetical protein